MSNTFSTKISKIKFVFQILLTSAYPGGFNTDPFYFENIISCCAKFVGDRPSFF